MTEQLCRILLNQLSTDSIVQLFSSHKIFTDDDLAVISFSPSEYLKSQLLLDNLQHFKLIMWIKICDIMCNDKSLEHIGSQLRDGELVMQCIFSVELRTYVLSYIHTVRMYVCTYKLVAAYIYIYTCRMLCNYATNYIATWMITVYVTELLRKFCLSIHILVLGSYHSSTFFVFKIIHVYLYCLASPRKYLNTNYFSVLLMKRCTRKYVYHSLDCCFSRLSSVLLSGRPVQAKCYNFKWKPMMC